MIRHTILTALVVLALGQPLPAAAASPVVDHVLAVRLDPAGKTLSATDRLQLPRGLPKRLALSLSGKARDVRLRAGGADLAFTRAGDACKLSPPPGAAAIELSYSLPLDAPPDNLPPTMDNPGGLASDSVAGQDWVMLMPASLWHPVVEGAANRFSLEVHAPPGVKAVTQGALDGFSDHEGRSVSRWRITHPVERLGLCAAPYVFRQGEGGPVPVQTFLLAPNAHLADTYLGASAAHLGFYQNLHGPYPFEKFAVVENPLPTGYGFASYTLLGSQVIALPFIPQTSLRHEIVHSWWGNGVLVDYGQGNWCEGLTTYLADYLALERASEAEGRAYRLQALRSFADLAATGGDFPLKRFVSRDSPASQAVGYSKAMFVFHMLRRQVGDEAFFEGLRRLFARKLFTRASWEDIRLTFAGLPGFSQAYSERFFAQWLGRTGGPRLRLDGVRAEASPAGAIVSGAVAQEGAPYELALPLALDTALGPVRQTLALSGVRTAFVLAAKGQPSRLTADQHADVFRLLGPEELPPSVNSVKGSRAVTVIVAASAGEAVRQALPALLAALGQAKAPVVEEGALSPEAVAGISRGDVLFAGVPGPGPLAALVPANKDLALAADGFALAQSPAADTLFAVLARPGEPGRFTAVLQAAPQADPARAAAAAAKTTHYGKFGALAFTAGQNTAKLVWDAPASPLERDVAPLASAP